MKHLAVFDGDVCIYVAPRRGAWIETELSCRFRNAGKSHPAGVRGLKPPVDHHGFWWVIVAPRRGAWIETLQGH